MEEKVYKLKTNSQELKVPSFVYDRTADLYSMLTGQDNEKVHEHFKKCNPDCAMLVLDALKMQSGALFMTNYMIGDIPVGQDIMWLGICRGKLNWHIKNERKPYREYLNQASNLIRILVPDAKEQYDKNRSIFSRMASSCDKINLGVEILDLDI